MGLWPSAAGSLLPTICINDCRLCIFRCVGLVKSDAEMSEQVQAVTDARGVFGISVAAEMAETEIQNLRVYERRGLVDPARTPGGTRRYSQDDVDRVTRIRDLLAEGLNLAGVARVLALEARLAELEDRLQATEEA